MGLQEYLVSCYPKNITLHSTIASFYPTNICLSPAKMCPHPTKISFNPLNFLNSWKSSSYSTIQHKAVGHHISFPQFFPSLNRSIQKLCLFILQRYFCPTETYLSSTQIYFHYVGISFNTTNVSFH